MRHKQGLLQRRMQALGFSSRLRLAWRFCPRML
nr:hypothetical protein [uncultured Desulfovibrio sp.]